MPDRKPDSRPRSGRILIVEDDSDILEVLKLMLEYEGHKVVAAKRGAAALEAAREKPFDVAVLDISMPDMSGIEVAQALRADPKTAGVRIAIHTGVEERWVRQRFADFDHYFAKARDVDVLVAGIAKLLAAPARTAGAAAGAAASPSPSTISTSTPTPTPTPTPSSTPPPAHPARAADASPDFGIDDVVRAQAALRRSLGFGPERFPLPRFLSMLGDEIARLREAGHDDATIAGLIGEATGRPLPAEALADAAAADRSPDDARYRPPPDGR